MKKLLFVVLFLCLCAYSRVLFAAENLLSYFLPAFQLLILIVSAFSKRKFSFWGCSIVIIYEFLPLFRELFGFLRGGNFQMLGRRFQSKMRNRLLNSFYQCFLSLIGICHRAYNNSDAIFRSLYRLLISKKKLLEWQTYSPFSANKKDPLLYYLPSIFISIFLARWATPKTRTFTLSPSVYERFPERSEKVFSSSSYLPRGRCSILTSPSTVFSSSTKTPKLVTPLTTPSNS